MGINFEHQNYTFKIKMKIVSLLAYHVNVWNLRVANRVETKFHSGSSSEDVGVSLVVRNPELARSGTF